MACKNCQKIRTAILHGRMAEAAGLTVKTLREKIGFKPAEEASLSTGGAVTQKSALLGEQPGETIMPTKESEAK